VGKFLEGGKIMNGLTQKILYWSPRLLAIAYILFLGIFALDVFAEGYGFWETMLNFLIHLIPNFVLLTLLLIAWKWEWFGALFFALCGLFYLVATWGKVGIEAYLLIIVPLCVLALLFLADWIYTQFKLHNTRS
jgi:hypothetical protein